MAHAPPQPVPDRTSVYREVTDRIIAELEAGRLPWVQPWSSDRVRAPLGLPANAATGRRYSGINILILWCAVGERGFVGQPRRWVIERTIRWIARCHRLARDYEATPSSALAFFVLAAAMILVRRLAHNL